MKSDGKVIRLFGHWRLLRSGNKPRALSSEWVNLAEELEQSGVPQAKLTAAGASSSDPGYWVVGDKLIVLNLDTTPASAA